VVQDLQPLAFVASALIIILNSLVRSPRESGIGLGIVLLGVPIYLVWTKTRLYNDTQNTQDEK
jgi:hypothetical protein